MLPTPPTWLVRTKLRPPLPRADTTSRARLLAQLDAAVARHPVTLIAAPAGAGKTSLLTTWLLEAQGAAGEGAVLERFAWLSLDAQDDDPALFLGALVAALDSIAPGCGAQVASTLASGADPGVELLPLVGLLINELHERLAAPAALILDDLHTLAHPAIARALTYLAERLPPQLRLIVATRHDPPIGLPRLRARRQLAELRLPELRFTHDEAVELLNSALGLALDPAQVGAIVARTEGWAAGIGMLAGSLEQIGAEAERERFLAGLQQTHRALFDYLAEEVLERQDPFVRMFLLETAILPALTPEACAAVTGRPDAAAILDELYRRNLFLVALDGHAAAYRYHDLFADFLRERLRREHPGWLRDLHRRAARHAGSPARALQHLLAAGLPGEAADLVVAEGPDLLRRGALPTLRQMIEALPAELRAATPAIAGLYAMALTQSWELVAARPWLEQAARALGAAGSADAQGELLSYLADTLRMLGDYPAARATAEAARRFALPPRALARRLLSDAWQSLADGDPDGAAASCAALLDLLEQRGDAGALYPVATGFHSPFLMLPGGVAQAERFYRLLATADQERGPLRAAGAAIGAWCAFMRGQPGAAEAGAAEAVAIAAELGGLPWIDLDGAMLPWLLAGLRGDLDVAHGGYERFVRRLDAERNNASVGWLPLYASMLARLDWLHGHADRFRAATTALVAAAAPTDWPSAGYLRQLLQGLVALDQGAFAEAEALLRASAAGQARYVELRLGGDARIALAQLYQRWGRPDDALAALEPALAELERENTPGLLLLEGARLVAPLLRLAVERGVRPAFAARALQLVEAELATWPGPEAVPSGVGPAPLLTPGAGLLDPLTARELEVLALLGAGASNQQISETLVISLHTTKRHVTNILQKLDATSRLDAVARARALGLL